MGISQPWPTFGSKLLFQFGLRLFFHARFHTTEHLSPGVFHRLHILPDMQSILIRIVLLSCRCIFFFICPQNELNSTAFLPGAKRETIRLPLHSSDIDFTYTHVFLVPWRCQVQFPTSEKLPVGKELTPSSSSHKFWS